MGNCLQSPTSDDISLLRGSDGNPDTNDASDLDSPPPYNQEQVTRRRVWWCQCVTVFVVALVVIVCCHCVVIVQQSTKQYPLPRRILITTH